MQTLAITGPHIVHRMDPVLLEVWGFKLYFYGLAYGLGFLGVYAWLRRRQERLGWSMGEIFDFAILFAVCALVFGRAFDILIYERDYYSAHLSQLLIFWRGGMASHGVILGAVVGTWLFSRLRNKSFFSIADELVIPAALFLGLGRIGNFINGQIYGHVTNVWWAVKFPGADGFRHPVTLYESLKNFMLIPILLCVRRNSSSCKGKLFAHFVFWYGFLRLFTDCFREYSSGFLGIGTGQYFNLLTALIGLGFIIRFSRPKPALAVARPTHRLLCHPTSGEEIHDERRWWNNELKLNVKIIIFVALLILSLAIPSSWTQRVVKNSKDRKTAEQVNAIKGNSNERF